MNDSSSLPYRLRPNKAVDRELFLSLLSRLTGVMKLERYKYVGLGGPFLEDFRLVHSRVGIQDMVCVEADEKVHKRQLFNKPFPSIECVHSTIEDYLDETDFDSPVILWLDYSDPQGWPEQIQRFARATADLPIRSILRITLNANPSSLGKPSGKLARVKELHPWRLERFRERIGASSCPRDIKAADMRYKQFGRVILRTLKLAVEKEALSYSGREVFWALSTHYADGQPMVTATVLLIRDDDAGIQEVIKNWEFYCTPSNPHVLAMPALSALERLIMESSPSPGDKLGYELPKSDIGDNPFENFKKFYRVYPHFSRVDL